MKNYEIKVYDTHEYTVTVTDLVITESIILDVNNYSKIYNTITEELIIYKAFCPKLEVIDTNFIEMDNDTIHNIWNANIKINNNNKIDIDNIYSVRNFDLQIENQNKLIHDLYRKINMKLEVRNKLLIILDMTIAQYKRLAVFDSLRLCDLDPLTLDELDIVEGSLK